MNFRQLSKTLFCTTILCVMASCTSYKNVPYLKNPEAVNEIQQDLPLYDAKIMPKDLLSITVNTSDPAASAPFNLEMQTPVNVAMAASSQARTTTMPSLQQYLVTNEGTIEFPVIGTLKVGGLTKTQTENMIVEKLKPYLKETPIVNVRMANYKISVLGEVAHPGTFNISNEKVNVLEALAMAGDMTIHGVRDNVKLIREDAEGKRQIISLDLNNAGVVTSPYYYLNQNDIIYVTPNKTKAKNSEIGRAHV